MPRSRKQLIRREMLIIDDLEPGGIDPSLRPALLEIVDLQSNHGPLLLTRQLPIDNWHTQLGNPTVADAILDRIVRQAHHLPLQGECIRKTRDRGEQVLCN